MSDTNIGAPFSHGPAFPSEMQNHSHEEKVDAWGLTMAPGYGNKYPGISVRDYFAARAMQAIYIREIENEASVTFCEESAATMREVAVSAYRLADAMLAAREAK